MQPISITSDPLWRLAVTLVRAGLRDDPALNRLISGEETNDRMIGWAIADILDDFTISPPLIGTYNLSDFLSETATQGFSIIRTGATAVILESIVHLKMRNYMSYADGNVTVSTEEGIPQMMNLMQFLRNAYENKKQKLKVAHNIERALGVASTHSPYWIINGGIMANLTTPAEGVL